MQFKKRLRKNYDRNEICSGMVSEFGVGGIKLYHIEKNITMANNALDDFEIEIYANKYSQRILAHTVIFAQFALK